MLIYVLLLPYWDILNSSADIKNSEFFNSALDIGNVKIMTHL